MTQHPEIHLNFSPRGSRALRWKIVKAGRADGTREPVTSTISLGSKASGHGLLVRWGPSGETFVHRSTDVELEGDTTVTWIQITLVHHDGKTILCTDIPIQNAAAREHAIVHSGTLGKRAAEISVAYGKLLGEDL